MSDIDRFKPEDRRGVDLLYRRTHGADAAEATRLRWDWQHRRNSYNHSGQPGIWVAREGPTVIGQYPTIPVRVSLKGLEVEGAWGADAMVAPEREWTVDATVARADLRASALGFDTWIMGLRFDREARTEDVESFQRSDAA